MKKVLIIFVVFFTVLILLLLPWIIAARAMAQRMQCQANEKNIARAVNIYEEKHKRYPPSCFTKILSNGDEPATVLKDGYSFLVEILPFLEQEELWKQLPLDRQLTADDTERQTLSLSMPIFRCPSSRTAAYVDRKATPLEAITNYKAVSASTRKAYEVSSRTDVPAEGLDIYGIGINARASDGVMYPGSRTSVMGIGDGVTDTLLLTETEEPTYSRWIVGQECGLYTMTDDAAFSAPTDDMWFVHPAGYTLNKYGEDSTIPPEMQKTNLSRDYVKNPYPWGEAGFRSEIYSKAGKAGNASFGPSSSHKNVVTHTTVGGTVLSISTDTDAAVYFFWTTRNGGDPGLDCPCLP